MYYETAVWRAFTEDKKNRYRQARKAAGVPYSGIRYVSAMVIGVVDYDSDDSTESETMSSDSENESTYRPMPKGKSIKMSQRIVKEVRTAREEQSRKDAKVAKIMHKLAKAKKAAKHS